MATLSTSIFEPENGETILFLLRRNFEHFGLEERVATVFAGIIAGAWLNITTKSYRRYVALTRGVVNLNERM